MFRHGGGHLLVHHVDHAADGAAAIQQRRRAAQHFDAFGQQRLDGHGVVGGNAGGIHHFGAIGQHFHARRGLAAYHRTAGAATKCVAVDTRQARQGLTQRAAAPFDQFVAFQHRSRQRGAVEVQAQGVGGNRNGRQRLCALAVRIGLGLRDRCDQHQRAHQRFQTATACRPGDGDLAASLLEPQFLAFHRILSDVISLQNADG
ncbi:hypothetical protein D3C73_1088740 [compost metagenome]